VSYYYLVSSLPAVSLDDPPEFTVRQFTDLCRDHLSPGDMDILTRVLDDRSEDTDRGFPGEWRRRETELRNTLAAERASRQNRDPDACLRPETHFDSHTRRGVHDALAKNDPKQTEFALDRLRWSIVEDIRGFDPFSTRSVLAYGIKLKLAERWARMDREAAEDKVTRIIETSTADVVRKGE
jgi:hypothetical protein